MTNVVEAVLTANDKSYTSTMQKAMGVTDSFAKKVAGGIGFGALLRIGSQAVDTIGRGVKSLVGDIDSTNAAWKSFRSNMEMIGRGAEVDKVKKELQDFAAKTVYTSADMAQTYSQLAAVGTKNTSKLVQGFGMVAAAAENPQQAMKTLSTQATQMAAKPTVAWQDFKLMLEQTPAGISQVAKAMDMTTTELVQNVQDGKVATEDFFDAIIKAADAKELQEMAKQYKTIGQAADGVKATLVNRLAPAWEKINQLGIKRMSELMTAFAGIDADALADKVGAAVDKIDGYIDKMITKVQQAGGLKNVFLSLAGGVGAMGMAFSVAGKGMLPSLNFLGSTGMNILKNAKTTVTGFGKGFVQGFGEAAAAAGKTMPAALNKVLTVFGTFGSRLTAIMGPLKTIMSTGLAALSPALLIGGALVALGLLNGAFGEQINAIIQTATTQGPQIITSLGQGITSALPALMEQGATLLTNLLNAIAANIPAIMTQGTAIIQTLVQGVISAIPTLIPAAFNAIGQFLIGLGTALPQLITSGLQLIAALAQGIASNLPQLLVSAITAIAQFGIGIVQNLPMILQCGLDIMQALVRGIVDSIVHIPAAVKSVISAIKDAITGNKGEVESAGQEQGQALTESVATSAATNAYAVQTVGTDTAANFSAGVNSGMSGMTVDTSAITSSFEATAGAAQSSGTSIGTNFGSGVQSGVNSANINTSSVTNALQQTGAQAQSAGQQVGQKFAAGIKSKTAQAQSAGKSAAQAATANMRSGYSAAYSAGAHISQGMAAGMRSCLGSIRAAASAMVSAANQAVRAKAMIHSPSKLFDKQGKYIGQGLVNGIMSKVKAADKAGKVMIGSLLKTMKKAAKSGKFESTAKTVSSKLKTTMERSLKSLDKVFSNASSKLTKNKGVKNMLSTIKDKLDTAYKSAMNSATTKIENLGKKYQEKYNEIINAQKAFTKELGSSELFKTKNGKVKFADFKSEQAEITSLGKNIEKLKKILPRGLMDEIVSMDKADALKYTNAMLEMSTADIKAYGKTYTAYQNKAAAISKTFYSDRVAEVKNNYTKAVDAEFKKLKASLAVVGKQAVQGFANGMKKNKGKLNKETLALVNSVIKTAKKKLKIKSPSRVFEEIGAYTGEGFALGLDKTQADVQASIDNMLNAADFNKQMANKRFSGSLQDEYDYNIAARYEIVVPLEVNGREFARATANDMQTVINQNEIYAKRKRGIR